MQTLPKSIIVLFEIRNGKAEIHATEKTFVSAIGALKDFATYSKQFGAKTKLEICEFEGEKHWTLTKDGSPWIVAKKFK